MLVAPPGPFSLYSTGAVEAVDNVRVREGPARVVGHAGAVLGDAVGGGGVLEQECGVEATRPLRGDARGGCDWRAALLLVGGGAGGAPVVVAR